MIFKLGAIKNVRLWIYATAVTNKMWMKKQASINNFEKIFTFYKIKIDL